MTNVSIYYASESGICMKSYDHFNFSRASVVQLRTSRYIMCLNRTSVWIVLTIWISWELPLFNFERLDIWCAWIGPPCEKLWRFEILERSRASITNVSIYYAPESDIRMKSYDHFNFSRASVVQYWASRYIMSLNRTSEWKVMTIWISRGLPLFNFERLDILCAWIRHPSENLWPFELLESIRCSITTVSIYYAPESDIWVKSYDHFNFSRASVVQFRESRYIMRLNRTSEWKVTTIWISREHPLLNYERLHILCTWIGNPREKLWPCKFLESFRCWNLTISIYDALESDLRVKS